VAHHAQDTGAYFYQLGPVNDMTESNDHLTDRHGNRVEITEAYLCSDHVWVRNEDGSSKVIRTRDLHRERER
jgi:hypothetical protein